jgi:hypothetical protein
MAKLRIIIRWLIREHISVLKAEIAYVEKHFEEQLTRIAMLIDSQAMKG